jgi:hypothetical protein
MKGFKPRKASTPSRHQRPLSGHALSAGILNVDAQYDRRYNQETDVNTIDLEDAKAHLSAPWHQIRYLAASPHILAQPK